MATGGPAPAADGTMGVMAQTTSTPRDIPRDIPRDQDPTASARADEPAIVTVADQGFLDELEPPDGVELRYWGVDVPAREVLGDDAGRVRAVVLPYGSGRLGLEHLSDLPALDLVQSLSAGVDPVVGRLPDGIRLANGAGVHDASTAELAIGLVLSSLRGLDEAVRDQDQARWHPVSRTSLADSRVLLLGVGGIGSAIARRLRPFEVEIIRVGRSSRGDDQGLVHAQDELPALLPHADVVIVSLPLTDSTRGIVDADFLAAMRGQSLLVNVGRGPLVDTGALAAELRTGRLHAALDVTDPEPLPQDHPLWGLPGIIITPHIGGGSSAYRARALALIRAQLRRVARGADPVNEVSPV